jgi:type III secretion protein R
MLDNGGDIVSLIVMLGALALIPFLAVMGTSFLKIIIVFSLLRNALGIQQIPPNLALYGIALILTLYIMAPVGFQVMEFIEQNPEVVESSDRYADLIEGALTPYIEFLDKNTTSMERNFFISEAQNLWPAKYADKLDEKSLLVLMPAFTVTQVTEAFKIGFLLYLPFIVIDMIVSNILLAMGMMMVSPMTISLPFKLLLFVLLDGWTRLTHALISTY